MLVATAPVRLIPALSRRLAQANSGSYSADERQVSLYVRPKRLVM